MQRWSFFDLAVLVLGAIGAVKMLATAGLAELKETLAAVFDFLDWLRRRWNRLL